MKQTLKKSKSLPFHILFIRHIFENTKRDKQKKRKVNIKMSKRFFAFYHLVVDCLGTFGLVSFFFYTCTINMFIDVTIPELQCVTKAMVK